MWTKLDRLGHFLHIRHQDCLALHSLPSLVEQISLRQEAREVPLFRNLAMTKSHFSTYYLDVQQKRTRMHDCTSHPSLEIDLESADPCNSSGMFSLIPLTFAVEAKRKSGYCVEEGQTLATYEPRDMRNWCLFGDVVSYLIQGVVFHVELVDSFSQFWREVHEAVEFPVGHRCWMIQVAETAESVFWYPELLLIDH